MKRSLTVDAMRCLRFGGAFGSFCGIGSAVTLGATIDSPETRRHLRALRAGLQAAGCTVLDTGILPLSTQRLLTREEGAAGGITLHNGTFVLTGGNGAVWEDPDDLFHWEDAGAFRYVSPDAFGEIKTVPRGFGVHLRKLSAAVDVEQIRSCSLQVALCAPESAGVCAEDMLRKWNCTVFQTDDPADLPRLAAKENVQIGFLLDGSGSFCRVCGKNGQLYPAQMTAALVLEHLLEAFPDPAAVTGGTGNFAEKIACAWNSPLLRSGKNEGDLWELMRQNAIVLGCCGTTGGILWKRVQNTFDAFAAMALLLEMLALSGMEIETIINPIQEKII